MTDQPTTLLILGASGDLTRRLLLPGLGSLLKVEPDRQVRVVGADRAELSQHEWAQRVRESFVEAEAPQGAVDRVVGQTAYQRTDALDEDQLRELIGSVPGSLVIYFALPPQVTVGVCALLERIGVPEGTRLAMEKPFGHDLASARELNAQATQVVAEEQIHRIDHFLGVNTVLNLLGLRFANRIFQPLWSADHIAKVEIEYDEDLALEGRAGYYDKAGALIDMTQSHLLQVLAMFAMESPASLDAEEMRSLKSQVLRATRLWGGDPRTASRRARYTAGRIGDRDVPDYVDEEGVDPERGTETLAELVVEIRNQRWAGVPFLLRSGKALGVPHKEITVTFREPAHIPDGLRDCGAPDRLVLQLRPGAVTLDVSVNAEGDPFDLEQAQLHTTLGQPRMRPYGEVLAGILDSNPLLSIRGDAAELMWELVEPVLTAWRNDEVPLEVYPAGSQGPEGWGTIPPR
ncbi:glucose-6-phosphate dehydrogenase [Ornithinimicrobium pratense]|uniref:Glucose-6-phosphate dehydrogenase n=1 Tax=Ornithinimicrobium pratense TaxID=2593973 RepID=A0A5J6V9V4_9MICO|nr:glucose-6-phosphate dehydrogenase [Ornithinimicrobium pratense]QFG69842.1 glucose-6-phosphate dehydrogenase [Ornithinimicrobium pratense]